MSHHGESSGKTQPLQASASGVLEMTPINEARLSVLQGLVLLTCQIESSVQPTIRMIGMGGQSQMTTTDIASLILRIDKLYRSFGATYSPRRGVTRKEGLSCPVRGRTHHLYFHACPIEALFNTIFCKISLSRFGAEAHGGRLGF